MANRQCRVAVLLHRHISYRLLIEAVFCKVTYSEMGYEVEQDR